MIRPRLILGIAMAIVASCISSFSQTPASPASPFLGRWDLARESARPTSIPRGSRYSSRNGHLTARMVGRWGRLRGSRSQRSKSLPKENKLTFVSPKDEEGSKSSISFSFREILARQNTLRRQS